MKRPSDEVAQEGPSPGPEPEGNSLRDRIIGLGERSFRKSYYPQLQQRLLELERFRAVLDRSVDVILLLETPHGRIVDANESALVQLGLNRERLPNSRLSDVLLDHGSPEVRMLLGGGLPPGPFECELQGPLGKRLRMEMNVQQATVEGERYAVAVARDITERERMQRALRQSAAQLNTVVDGLPVALFALDASGAFRLAEGRCEDAFGHQAAELLGRPYTEAIADRSELVDAARRALGGEEVASTLSGNSRVFELKCTPLKGEKGGSEGAIGVAVDVTDRLQLQARLVLADRLASVGTLAAGVAHEINNPLAYVVANVRFLRDELKNIREEAQAPQAAAPPAFVRGLPERMGELEKCLSDVADGVERVRVIVRDLKSLSRADEESATLVDVRTVLETTASMVAREVRHRAQLVKDYGPVPLVSANQARLGQVFLNLAVNAAQSIPEGHRTQNQVRFVTRTDEAGRALVEIGDTGSGISREHLHRIFDPFFTTKPVGVGTGLGLAICHGIVTALGGEISVASTVGQGTTFRVVLPPGRTAAELAEDEGPVYFFSPGGRVLVVDDDVLIGPVVERILSPPYKVVFLSDPRQARARLMRGERFDAVLCDLMMPELTGMDLYSELEQVLPEQARRMVFFSGGAFTPAAAQFVERVGPRCLEKPFTPEALRQLLATIAEPRPPTVKG